MRRMQQGFTLIELAIVTAIIGILAVIAIPSFIAMQNRAKEGTVMWEMSVFQQAVKDYAAQHDGKYPQLPSEAVMLLPRGEKQINPYTKTEVIYNYPHAGNISYSVTDTSYVIGGWAISGVDRVYKMTYQLTNASTQDSR